MSDTKSVLGYTTGTQRGQNNTTILSLSVIMMLLFIVVYLYNHLLSFTGGSHSIFPFISTFRNKVIPPEL